MSENNHIARESLLQEGVSCAIATLHAIEGSDLFQAIPDGDGKEAHGHGCWLLAMLASHLAELQHRVDALSGRGSVPTTEGR